MGSEIQKENEMKIRIQFHDGTVAHEMFFDRITVNNEHEIVCTNEGEYLPIPSEQITNIMLVGQKEFEDAVAESFWKLQHGH